MARKNKENTLHGWITPHHDETITGWLRGHSGFKYKRPGLVTNAELYAVLEELAASSLITTIHFHRDDTGELEFEVNDLKLAQAYVNVRLNYLNKKHLEANGREWLVNRRAEMEREELAEAAKEKKEMNVRLDAFKL